ncbi:MAG: prepilin-type N-terminal cleavage/methylation domain-containing protein [Armatimonadetes bacterium]|nr:prepilin-type N-terminal cleavage/methylation domain-containing protein [Armatimonadota bacterium]MBS1711774.1 prepilin-type N-terminal cleavage/methylation domain-containing protein [Armatimonadota bacterium]MBX3109672.1 prepilin-type N-terminal cleavage/methylation domain-containing protein [Fimbriimonadaceae bacterium]
MSAKHQSAFTLVEVVVAAFILAVGITGLMGALSGLSSAEIKVAQRDLIYRIAAEKLDELVATEAWKSEAGGSFDDTRLSDYTWSIQEVNTGVENVTGLTLTVSSTSKGEVTVSTLVFEPPQTSGGTQGT